MRLDDDDVSPWRPAATHGMTADEVRAAILNAAREMFSFTPAGWAAQVAIVDAMVPTIVRDMALTSSDRDGAPGLSH